MSINQLTEELCDFTQRTGTPHTLVWSIHQAILTSNTARWYSTNRAISHTPTPRDHVSGRASPVLWPDASPVPVARHGGTFRQRTRPPRTCHRGPAPCRRASSWRRYCRLEPPSPVSSDPARRRRLDEAGSGRHGTERPGEATETAPRRRSRRTDGAGNVAGRRAGAAIVGGGACGVGDVLSSGQ